MQVLIACEESQAVCTAFRARGHEAYSCDVQSCALYDHIEWHITDNALNVINGDCEFMTVDGQRHSIRGGWDLLIAHPPCTYLTSSSGLRLFRQDHSVKDLARLEKGWKAKAFFMRMLEANAARICVENPTPLRIWGLPPYTQIIEPFMFGDPWRKRTCLWLKNLEPLKPTNVVEPRGLWVGASSIQKRSKYELNSNRNPKIRSKTFKGVAEAMAEQWGH